MGESWTWTYDNAGNIASRRVYAYTTGALGPVQDIIQYAYDDSVWGDLLTEYDGRLIESDAIGNMLSDGIWTYTWEHGRQLATMTDSSTWTLSYDANGMRIGRSNGSSTYSYVYNGSQLSRMTVNGHTLDFTYDVSGRPLSVTYDGIPYFYVLNLQGDVVAILDSSGTAVVQYTYTAWGAYHTTSGYMTTSLGVHNPLRYRGYVYDHETELYYLQSRYYDPSLGRFLNADAFTSTGQGILGNNMFAYCNNNPINYIDPNGTFNISVSDGLFEIAFGKEDGTSYGSRLHIPNAYAIDSFKETIEAFCEFGGELLESNVAQDAMGINKIRAGVVRAINGCVALFAPDITFINEVYAVGQVAIGLAQIVSGLGKIFGWGD